MARDHVSGEQICVVAAAPSVTPWSVRRERAALREGGVGTNLLRALATIWGS